MNATRTRTARPETPGDRHAAAYPATIRPRAMRAALRRRPTAADRLRAAVARALVRAAAVVAPTPAPLRLETWTD